MDWLTTALNKIKKTFGKKDAGSSKGKCPLAETGLLVAVVRADNRRIVEEADVAIEGASGSSKNTDKNGLALFKPIDPDAYKINVTLPDHMADSFEKPEQEQETVSLGSCPVHVIKVLPLSTLKVRVLRMEGDKEKFLDGIKIHIKGRDERDGQTPEIKDGWVTFEKIKSGDYEISITSLGIYAKDYAIPAISGTRISAGQTKEVVFHVMPINIVTPKIEMEYKVVLLDRKLSDFQKGAGEKDPDLIYADTTYIVVYADQTYQNRSYKKTGKIKCSPANVEAYLDEKCTKKLEGDLASGIELKNEQITGPKKLKLYLRGKTAGKFKVSLEFEDPADKAFKLDKNPASEDMGVVELKMTPHQQDTDALKNIEVDPDTDPVDTYYTNLKNKALPNQKEMTDKEKIETGRLLHVQKDSNFDRAKLLLKQLGPNQWPAETDNYEIVINETNTDGAVEIYDAEWDGALKAFPVKIKVSKLKTEDQTFWVQGKSETKKLRNVRLDIGVDRAAGEPEKKPKRNGDWARFTVVKIKEVKVDYKAEAGKPEAWDLSQRQFYINLGAKWDDTEKKYKTDDKTDKNGRKITIGAQLSEELKDVTIHFTLAPDKDNLKTANWGIDFPSTAKWKDIPVELKHNDKENRKKLLHLSAKTDDKGYAKKELILSRFGGDKFKPACYIDQDPHLAKYVHGHTDLEKKEPKMADYSVRVWRRIWFKVRRPKDTAMPGDAGFVASQRKVFIQPKRLEEQKMKKTDFTVDPYRPKWQFNPGSASEDDVLCIGTHNVDDAKKLFETVKGEPFPTFHVILCDEQYDAKDFETDEKQVVFVDGAVAPKNVEMVKTGKLDSKVTIIDPPLQGGNLIVSANWTAQKKTGGVWNIAHRGTLPAGNVQVLKGRGSKRTVQVTRPVTCPGAAGGCPCGGAPANLPVNATNGIIIKLKLKGADGGYNGWAPKNSVANVVKGGRADFAIHNTMAHELGHLVGQVRSVEIDGLPNHPKMYQKRGGSGTHCAYNATWAPAAGTPALDPTKQGELDAQGKGAGKWKSGDCIIFGYAVNKKREWCKHCAFELIVTDLSKFK